MKKAILTIILVFIGAVVSPIAAQLANENSPEERNCTDKSARILILGSYHMDNPGQDTFNLKADDVLAPKRQQEIAELVEKLSRFKPTKIVIEDAYRNRYWTDRYSLYLEGKHQLGRNEIEQIGFRLAKQHNLPTVFPVDFPMWMNGTLASERQTPKPAIGVTVTSATSAPTPPDFVVKTGEIIRTETVLNIIRYMNSKERMLADHADYMNLLMPSEQSGLLYDKTDQLTNWYKRNFRMFTNINRVTEFPKDRVLLIVGSGHLTILRDLAINSPQFCLVDTNLYLK